MRECVAERMRKVAAEIAEIAVLALVEELRDPAGECQRIDAFVGEPVRPGLGDEQGAVNSSGGRRSIRA